MPLRDHFHPPLYPRHRWESFHSNWATRLADALNDKWLPPEFLAEECTNGGTHLEVDVATSDQSSARSESLPNRHATASISTPVWAPPAAPRTMPAVFPET